MNNQYFGDVHDFRKYGLIRALTGPGELSVLIAWMLTADDDKPVRAQRDYLHQPDKWRKYDEPLFDFLSNTIDAGITPSVRLIEHSSILPRASFFSEIVPDGRADREVWSKQLIKEASGADLVFLDPENGTEIKSRPVGHRNSSKYVLWFEIEQLWKAGSSLLIFQFKKREKTSITIDRLGKELRQHTGADFVIAINTKNVFYFLLAQPKHRNIFKKNIEDRLKRWDDQFEVIGLV